MCEGARPGRGSRGGGGERRRPRHPDPSPSPRASSRSLPALPSEAPTRLRWPRVREEPPEPGERYGRCPPRAEGVRRRRAPRLLPRRATRAE